MIVESGGEKFVVFRLGETLEQIARQVTDLVLENNGGSKAAAARALGINRTTLTERIKSRKIPRTGRGRGLQF